MRRHLPAVATATAAGLALLVAAPTASAASAHSAATATAADPIDAAVATLRHAPVYVGAATPTVAPSRLGGSTLDGLKVAVVPSGGPDPVAVAETIGRRLDPARSPLTVVVFEGHSYGVASTAHCGVGSLLTRVVDQHRAQLRSTDDVTATVLDFASRLPGAPADNGGCSGSSVGSTSFGDAASSGTGSSGSSLSAGTVAALVALGVVLAAVGLVVASRRRRRRRELADARAQVAPYVDRLAHEVGSLDPAGDRVAGQALADASERLDSARRQLAAAQTDAQLAAAGRTALEGLYAARTARTALGLPAGPDLPPVVASDAPHLDRPQQVTVQGRSFQGYPQYTPGAPYYYPGGYGVPGGWYGSPFWDTLLLGSMLGGFGGWGWGGGWGGYGMGFDNGFGSGFGTGYDDGYASGYDAAESGGDGGWSGSDWGDSGGGGDWGGGIDAGGGDWGGGGDWSGGNDNSGSW